MRTSHAGSKVWNKSRDELLIWDVISEPGEWHKPFLFSFECFDNSWLSEWNCRPLAPSCRLLFLVPAFDTRQTSSRLLMWKICKAQPQMRAADNGPVGCQGHRVGADAKVTSAFTFVGIPGMNVSNLWLKSFHNFSAKDSAVLGSHKLVLIPVFSSGGVSSKLLPSPDWSAYTFPKACFPAWLAGLCRGLTRTEKRHFPPISCRRCWEFIPERALPFSAALMVSVHPASHYRILLVLSFALQVAFRPSGLGTVCRLNVCVLFHQPGL